MHAATAIESVIMEQSMKRSHWYRLKPSSRWVWHWEGETENHFTARDTWPRGRKADGVGLGSTRWPGGVKGHRTQSLLSLELDNPSQSFSRILWMTSDTRAKHPRQSAEPLCCRILNLLNSKDPSSRFLPRFSPLSKSTLLISSSPNDLLHAWPHESALFLTLHFPLPCLHLDFAHMFTFSSLLDKPISYVARHTGTKAC